jgi:hypothetical protein
MPKKQVYSWFRITVCPSFYVIGCKEKAAQESRGLFGFHSFTSCPDCELIAKGYEFWGENGHLQSSAPDRASMCWQVGHMAKKVWSMQGGGLMRYKFRVGSPTYIKAVKL